MKINLIKMTILLKCFYNYDYEENKSNFWLVIVVFSNQCVSLLMVGH